MQFQHIGYFPKLTSFQAGAVPSHVRELCSVSTCLAAGPPDWIEHWRHNDLFFFNSIADAQSVVPAGAIGYSVFAYRLLLLTFSDGQQIPLSLPPINLEPIPPSYVTLGFDAASKSLTPFFEHSPLSCSGEAATTPVNEYCLFTTAPEAKAAATRWSIGEAEPGDYYVIEVLREQAGITSRLVTRWLRDFG
jgi:hypothetical protein